MKKKILSILLAVCLMVAFVPVTVFATTEIDEVEIQLIYYGEIYEGDRPESIARQIDENKDNCQCIEYWEEVETDESGKVVPVKYWYSDDMMNEKLTQDKRITTFEGGKTYRYGVLLTGEAGYIFTGNCKLYINGVYSYGTIQEDGKELLVEVMERVAKQEIETVEINDVILEFNDGGKPVFAGKCSDSRYWIHYEAWLTPGAGISSVESFNGALDYWGGSLITAFDKNEQYIYELSVVLSLENIDAGWFFGPNTKLVINGKEVDYIRDADYSEQHFIVGVRDLITIQESDEIPDYKIIEGTNSSWTKDSNETLTVRADGDFSKFTGIEIDGVPVDSENYTATSGSTVITLKNDYLKTLSAGTHSLTVVYTDGSCSTNFEIKAAQSTGGDNTPVNPDNNKTNQDNGDIKQDTDVADPNAGESNSLALWCVLLAVSASGFVGNVAHSRKRKVM